jgi:hypothetical protein
MPTSRSVPPQKEAPLADETEQRGSRVMRFGAAVSAVLLSSAIATMPAVVRVAPEVSASCGARSVFVALLALAFVPLALSTVVVRHALAALRLFDARAVRSAVPTVLVWVTGWFASLMLVGTFLRANTHHHGLAGVTFAVFGLALAAALAVLSIRLCAWVRAAPGVVRGIAAAVLALVLSMGLVAASRALSRTDASSAFAVDLVAFAIATGFGAGAFPRRTRPPFVFALLGPPLGAVILVVGGATVQTSGPLRASVRTLAPVLAFPLALASPPAESAPGEPSRGPH